MFKVKIIIFFLMIQIIGFGQNNFNSYDQIQLQSGVFINCLLLIEGKDPKALSAIKILDKNLNIQEIRTKNIKQIIDLNGNVLYQTEVVESKEGQVQKSEEVKKSNTKKVNCTICNGLGKISKKCTSNNCQNGFINATCSTCNGNYRSGNGICPNVGCNFEGCEYCDYDGAACTKCSRGKTTIKHNLCNGTGLIKTECSTCNGKGYTIK